MNFRRVKTRNAYVVDYVDYKQRYYIRVSDFSEPLKGYWFDITQEDMEVVYNTTSIEGYIVNFELTSNKISQELERFWEKNEKKRLRSEGRPEEDLENFWLFLQ